MGYVAITLVAAAMTVVATRGAWRGIPKARFRLPSLLAAGLILQTCAVMTATILSSRGKVLFAALLASYLVLALFCLVNHEKRGMAVIAFGLGLNAVVIGVNHGMPTRTPDGHPPIERTLKHRPATGDDHLPWLADSIWLPRPVSSMVSAGDIAISLGVCGVAFAVTRRRSDELDRAPTSET